MQALNFSIFYVIMLLNDIVSSEKCFQKKAFLFVCLFVCLGFFCISTFVGYLMPNPFLYK